MDAPFDTLHAARFRDFTAFNFCPSPSSSDRVVGTLDRGKHLHPTGDRSCRKSRPPCRTCCNRHADSTQDQSLHLPLHGGRGVLSLFPRSLNVLAETVNRVAGQVRAREDQDH